ncbi:MAG: hypothetical protein ABJB12_06845 [Pseudomonadota bacterium]
MAFRFGDVLRVSWLLASVTLSCGVRPQARAHAIASARGTSPQPNVPPTQDPRSQASEAKTKTRAACAATAPATLPHLQSILNIKPRDVYWVNVVATGGEWALAEPVVFPRHHALRLEFTNQGEFPAFPERPKQALRVSFEVIAQDIQQVAGRPQWRNTVSARLFDVCPLAQ